MKTWNTVKTASMRVQIEKDIFETVHGDPLLFSRHPLSEIDLCFLVDPQDALDILNSVERGQVAIVRALTPNALSRLENLGTAIEDVERETRELERKSSGYLAVINGVRAECLAAIGDSGDWDSSKSEFASEILRFLDNTGTNCGGTGRKP